MSFVSIKIAGPSLALEQVRRLQQEATRIAVDALGATPELTAVLVQQVAVQGWSVGGAPTRVATHVEVKVPMDSATSAQKERFVAETGALLRQVLGGEVPTASYVLVLEVPADAWGVDGRSWAPPLEAGPQPHAT
jgi:4-oxalocrotonate tautomerase